jgi:hypothetical protein
MLLRLVAAAARLAGRSRIERGICRNALCAWAGHLGDRLVFGIQRLMAMRCSFKQLGLQKR